MENLHGSPVGVHIKTALVVVIASRGFPQVVEQMFLEKNRADRSRFRSCSCLGHCALGTVEIRCLYHRLEGNGILELGRG